MTKNSTIRLLVIDDNKDIHEDFRKVFAHAVESSHSDLDQMQADFFDDAPAATTAAGSVRDIQIDSAYQGKDGIDAARKAVRAGQPHLMAFVDVRMPPGIDGVQTIKRLWEEFPDLPCVLCTAYSDYNWQETRRELTHANNLLILKKPFDPVEVLQIVESIAEKSELARQGHEYRRELERQITELQRTQCELRQSNEALATARAQAEMAAHAKGEFLANMSHELRTPLNGVIAMMDMMLYTKLDGQQDKYVRTAKCSGETLLDLINDILDYSKIESGKVILEETEFLLHRELEAVNTVVARKCQEKGLELASFIDPKALLRLRGDPARVRQVLANLTSNAVKFTTAGEVTTEITVDREEGEKVWIKFVVSDTGIGVPADRHDRLFQSFSQVDASTTRKYGGTGLGLAISKQLCELMGGSIGFQSVPGAGSTFWFTLPFVRAPGGEESACVLPPDFKQRRLVLVADKTKTREILERQLRAWGLQVQTVDSLPAAANIIDPVDAEQPACTALILDCELGHMGATNLVENVKGLSRLSRVPLVLLIPLGQPSPFGENSQQPVAGFVNKPINSSELFNVLISLTHPRANGDRAAPSPTGPASSSCRLPVPRTRYENARILLAEDNAINQKVATQILKCFGYSFDVVANGKEAVDALREGGYDLVLMDCQMPEMDGYEATRVIRNWEQKSQAAGQKSLPIIALTANALEGDRTKCLNAGMTDYLSKPLRPEQLLETIEKYLHEALKVEMPKEESAEDCLPVPAPKASRTNRGEPIELAAFVDRCMGDRDFAWQVLAEFQTQLPGEISRLLSLAETSSTNELVRQAHTIKGLAANISAEPLRAAACQLEQVSRAGDHKDVENLLQLVQAESQRLQEFLNARTSPAGAAAADQVATSQGR